MIKIGAVAWGLPGGGYYSPKIAKSFGLDGIQLELGSYEMGYPLSQDKVISAYTEDAHKYSIEYPALVLNDLMEHEFINGKNTENSKIAYEQLEIGVETAKKLNISKIMIPNFIKNLILTEEHIENTVEYLQYACDYAIKYNIEILTENALDWKEQNTLLKDVERENISIHFDTQNFKFNFNMNQLEQLEKLYPLMDSQIHVKDGINLPGEKLLGEGNTLFDQQMSFLKENNFEGWLILENYYNLAPLRTSVIEQNENLISDIKTIKSLFDIS